MESLLKVSEEQGEGDSAHHKAKLPKISSNRLCSSPRFPLPTAASSSLLSPQEPSPRLASPALLHALTHSTTPKTSQNPLSSCAPSERKSCAWLNSSQQTKSLSHPTSEWSLPHHPPPPTICPAFCYHSLLSITAVSLSHLSHWVVSNQRAETVPFSSVTL